MNKLRIILLGFMIGGGLGAKTGAYLATLLVDTVSWPFVELGAGIGVFVGCTVSTFIILFKANAENQSNHSKSDERMIATTA